MIINFAYAQAAGAGGGQGLLVQLLPLILIFVVFYFLLIRPQQKRVKQHKDMVNSLKVGSLVVTSGGIVGKVVNLITLPTIPPDVTTNEPTFNEFTISLCCFTLFCCGLIKRK